MCRIFNVNLFCYQGPSQLEKEYLTSLKWGSLFTDDHVTHAGNSKDLKYMNTLWGYIIRKYADIAIPRLEAITGEKKLIFCPKISNYQYLL